jgi:secondary thiamine-phosphate synthase enzyme
MREYAPSIRRVSRVYQRTITVTSRGRGTLELSREVVTAVRDAGVTTGLCHVYCHHTSASLILCENADPTVRRDLEAFMARLVPDGDYLFDHTDEGPDDMPAHVRAILTSSSLTVPVTRGALALGTWQGIYLWEHRNMGHSRQVTITVHGA